MVVQGREEAVVAAHVEHVDQTVAARRGQQAGIKEQNRVGRSYLINFKKKLAACVNGTS